MKVKGRVLSVASECVPFVKTGGLADVVGALPAALAPFGWQMRVMLPGYRALRHRAADWTEVWHEANLWGGEGRVLSGNIDGLDLMILDAPHLYDREGGPYGAHSGPGGDWWDNPQRLLLCLGLLPKLRGTARVTVGSLMFCTAMIGTLALRRPIWPMAARGMLGL